MPAPSPRQHLPLAPEARSLPVVHEGRGLQGLVELRRSLSEGPAAVRSRAEGERPAGEAATTTSATATAATAEEGDEGLLQVGDLAKAVGRTVRAIHLYEELGLLRPHTRSKGKYRLFDQGAVVRVRWIAKLQDLGLTLSEIQGVVREWEQAPSAPGAMQLMQDTYRARLAETRAQLARLRALETELAASLHYLDTCTSCDPARLLGDCHSCELHGCSTHPPELVAGFHAGQRPTAGPTK